jgi:hypothetical protein
MRMDAQGQRAHSRTLDMLTCKSKLATAIRDDLTHYSTEHLGRLYHEETASLIRLRNCNISRDELKVEIHRRRRRETCGFWLTILLLFIAAVASVIAAYEGWRTP